MGFTAVGWNDSHLYGAGSSHTCSLQNAHRRQSMLAGEDRMTAGQHILIALQRLIFLATAIYTGRACICLEGVRGLAAHHGSVVPLLTGSRNC